LRQIARVQFSEVTFDRWSVADRGAHRSERAAFRAILTLESAGLAGSPRPFARDSHRQIAALRRACLPEGGEQSHARTAARCARDARPAWVWSLVRRGDVESFWRSSQTND